MKRMMVFVDGENLAIRYGNMLKDRGLQAPLHRNDFLYIPNVAVWTYLLFQTGVNIEEEWIIRTYFYTAIQGDQPKIAEIGKQLKHAGVEAPRVFRRDKNRGSKQVDISLATDMLRHAAHKHYDIAVLIAGDEDYVPLVEAVQGEGARVHVWFLPDGLSPALQHSADLYRDIGYLLVPQGKPADPLDPGTV
jgi:uncharacterized LabA/DUF88 family protein